MSDWINTKFNDFYGIEKDVNKPRLGSFEILQNFDLRDKTGELRLRNGYDIRYSKISTATLTAKKISSIEYLKATSFWVDDHGGQEIIIQFTKQRVAAQTTLTPNYFDMLGVWIRPYWDGSSWVDGWQWLNEVIITKISSIVGTDQLNLYYQAPLTDNDLYKNWSIIHYSGTDYNVPHEISMIYSSEDDGTQNVKIYDSSHSWVANDKIMLMKNYFPPAVLNELYSITADDISIHNVFDDLRIGFGGQENRLAMAIGFRNRYVLTVDPDIEAINFNDLFLDPYNTISDFDNTFTLTIGETSGGSWPTSKIYYKIVALLDGFQRFEILSGDYTPTASSKNLTFPIKSLFGTFNKRLTGFEIYISENEDTTPFYLVKSVTLASDESGTGLSRDGNGYVFETTIVTYANFTEASEEMPDVLGYSLPAEYARSWDRAIIIEGKVYALNPYIDKRYENIISFSEISGSSSNTPDVLANSYFDVNDFDGDTGLALKKSPNGYLGVWSDNKFQLLHPDTGLPLGLGTIYKGTVSNRSIVNLGQELIWAGEFEIVENKGYQIADISKDFIRGDYRDISDKTNIIAVREEKGNCYRFFDGTEYEYILTERGWIKWKQYHAPTDYIIRRNGDVWFMKEGDIYYQSNYTDRKDSVSYSSIPFKLKSNPIDIRMLDASISFTQRIYINAFYVNSSSIPLGATFNIYLDGELYHSKEIQQLTDLFFRLPTGGNCKSFQIEITGNGYEEFNIYSFGVLWKPMKVGAINVKNY